MTWKPPLYFPHHVCELEVLQLVLPRFTWGVALCQWTQLGWPRWLDLFLLCVSVLISMRPHLNSSHTALKQHSKRARLNAYMLKILPVLHLLRSLLIKSGHMAAPCIGEGGKPTRASLTQVMNLVGSMSERVYHRLPSGPSDSCVKYTYLLSRPSKSHPYRVPSSAPEINICIR